jgi:hypothetical protein
MGITTLFFSFFLFKLAKLFLPKQEIKKTQELSDFFITASVSDLKLRSTLVV